MRGDNVANFHLVLLLANDVAQVDEEREHEANLDDERWQKAERRFELVSVKTRTVQLLDFHRFQIIDRKLGQLLDNAQVERIFDRV